jgi:hypothetical protein
MNVLALPTSTLLLNAVLQQSTTGQRKSVCVEGYRKWRAVSQYWTLVFENRVLGRGAVSYGRNKGKRNGFFERNGNLCTLQSRHTELSRNGVFVRTADYSLSLQVQKHAIFNKTTEHECVKRCICSVTRARGGCLKQNHSQKQVINGTSNK